jgi:hypothetical protein
MKMRVYIEKPTIRQRINVCLVNFTLWLASKIFTGEELQKEQTSLIKEFIESERD